MAAISGHQQRAGMAAGKAWLNLSADNGGGGQAGAA